MSVSFFVPGIPRPAGSKRAIALRKGGRLTGKVAVIDAAGQPGRDWRGDVRRVACDTYQGAPMEGPLSLRLYFVFPRPKSHYTSKGLLRPATPAFKTSAPDTTKLVRSVEDALKGVLWVDDALVVEQVATKSYGERPGVHLLLSPMLRILDAEQEGA